MRIRPFALALLLALGATACATAVRYRPGATIEVHDVDMLWERVKLVLESDGYLIDETETRRSELRLETRWQTLLAPSRFDGIRRRVKVKLVRLEGDAMRVDLAVEQERNTEVTEPMNPIAADWETDPKADLESREQVLQYKIESAFVPDRAE